MEIRKSIMEEEEEMRKDIHNIDHKIEKTKERVEESNISKRNKELILEYCKDRSNGFFGKTIGKHRLIKLLSFCKNISLDIKKDMDKVKEQDIKDFWIRINENDNYSEWTRSDYKKICKLWLKWLKQKKGLEIDLEFFHAGADKKKIVHLKRENFLEEKEIPKLLNACNNLRDRAIVHLLWDTGARISEVGELKIKNILFDDEGGSIINLKGKTGERSPYVIESIPSITQWLSIHPDKDNPEAFVFIGLGKSKGNLELLNYRTIYKILENLFKKAEIKKKFNPHLFRHSRALWAALRGWNNKMANSFFGWSDDSNMFNYYVKLGSEDLKNHMKAMYGDKKAEAVKKKEFIKCKCGRKNDPNHKHCFHCGALLNVEEGIKKQTQMEDLQEAISTLKKQIKHIAKGLKI